MDTQTLIIPAGPVCLLADLRLPPAARGLVLFIHGSGSSRISPRNRFVAERLERSGLATVLFNLLSRSEQGCPLGDGDPARATALLEERLLLTLDWLAAQPALGSLFPIGLFGASSGAALALRAAAARPSQIGAVVSRGGRPDLDEANLIRVQAPTLLIVGSRDREILRLNREVSTQLRCPHWLEQVPRTGHLFAEEGALERVAMLTRDWFEQWLLPASKQTVGIAGSSRRRAPITLGWRR